MCISICHSRPRETLPYLRFSSLLSVLNSSFSSVVDPYFPLVIHSLYTQDLRSPTRLAALCSGTVATAANTRHPAQMRSSTSRSGMMMMAFRLERVGVFTPVCAWHVCT